MLFSQLEFPIFLVVVLAIVWCIPTKRSRNSILLVASYYFYAYWDVRFCALLLASTVIDYLVARRIERSSDQAVRRRWLWLSLTSNLGMLAFFKYFNFFIDTARVALEPLGVSTQTLSIVLPVGISFYTFQTLSYTIDVYRRKICSTGSFIDFALYVAFFPQLVAGPIVRARELLPQLAKVPIWSNRRFYSGAQQFLRGAVKKVLLADRLGEMVDIVFEGPELYSGMTLGIAALAYTGQIYYDFSGYSDMAIGVAKMLGYRFPVNFRHPYLSTSLAEFWHRWHMTLSRWLRDYLYIPLGGNRDGKRRQYRNLMLTMTLGGLWHGAAWTFVGWGALHGAGLVIQRATPTSVKLAIPRPLGWLATMTVVLLGWILFRSSDFPAASVYVGRLTTFASGIDWYPPLVIGALFCLVIEHVAWRTRLRRAMRLPLLAWYSPIVTTLMIWALVLYSPKGFRPFVYFQF